MTIRLATFNAENLFARYRFKRSFDPLGEDGFTINDLAFEIYDETEKQITARAIAEVDADVIALQEIESLPVLDAFNSRYLARLRYRHRVLIDSFDPRRIDVAILSRHPIVHVRSYRHEKNSANTAWLFSRDCLEAAVEVQGKELILYVNHLKSMMEGRKVTHARRKEQAGRVAGIVDERWKDRGYEGNFAVLGDLNDYPEKDEEGDTALGSLIGHPGLENVVNRLPQDARWTHYYSGKDRYKQLDYLFLSKSLASGNRGLPVIMRKGLPYRAELVERFERERLPNVGEDNPKASDHAPVFMDVELD